jgi:hypothetical protein
MVQPTSSTVRWDQRAHLNHTENIIPSFTDLPSSLELSRAPGTSARWCSLHIQTHHYILGRILQLTGRIIS